MPTRIVREGILTSASVNSLTERAELFYRRLMSVADDYGRYYAGLLHLRVNCYPTKPESVSEADVQQMLSECIAAKLITIYGGGKYLLIANFNQQTRTKSKFPEPTENELLISCKADDKQMLSLVGGGDVVVVEGVGERGQTPPAPEIPTEDEAVARTMTSGIPEDFTRYVYQDWASRSGKDAGGVVVNFLPYVLKRWAREQVEWKAKTHKGRKSSAPENGSKAVGVPSMSEITAYAREKWADDDRHPNWASSFYRYWNDAKRQWKRGEKLIDWKPEFTKQVSNWRRPT